MATTVIPNRCPISTVEADHLTVHRDLALVVQLREAVKVGQIQHFRVTLAQSVDKDVTYTVNPRSYVRTLGSLHGSTERIRRRHRQGRVHLRLSDQIDAFFGCVRQASLTARD